MFGSEFAKARKVVLKFTVDMGSEVTDWLQDFIGQYTPSYLPAH